MLAIPAKLLIVDDDAALRGVLAAIFQQAGLSVQTAEDGFTALRAIRQEMPDILLSDLHMPGMSGFELLSVVRRRLPWLHVIAMSGAFSGDGTQLGVPADSYYQKGGKLDALLQMVKVATLQKRHMPERLESHSPLWITVTGHDLEGAFAVISCPECLRTLPLSIESGQISIQRTQCTHCNQAIEYGVLQAGDAALPQACQRKLVGAMPRCRRLASGSRWGRWLGWE